MSKYLWLFIVSMGAVLCADTLDKKKILEIIKAAKQHKTVPKRTMPVDISKRSVPKAEPIIIYRKKETPVVYKKREVKIKRESKHVIYGTLPALAPSGIELQKKFNAEAKVEKKEMFFTKPQKNRETGINTEAIRIEYD